GALALPPSSEVKPRGVRTRPQRRRLSSLPPSRQRKRVIRSGFCLAKGSLQSAKGSQRDALLSQRGQQFHMFPPLVPSYPSSRTTERAARQREDDPEPSRQQQQALRSLLKHPKRRQSPPQLAFEGWRSRAGV